MRLAAAPAGVPPFRRILHSQCQDQFIELIECLLPLLLRAGAFGVLVQRVEVVRVLARAADGQVNRVVHLTNNKRLASECGAERLDLRAHLSGGLRQAADRFGGLEAHTVVHTFRG